MNYIVITKNSYELQSSFMKIHTSLNKDFKKKKELITKDGQIKFQNKKSNIKTQGLKKSSQKWLGRQLRDPFANAAKIEGYLARSAYKLLEIQNKYHIINNQTNIIIDLGCSPGSWSQAILTNQQFKGSKVIGIDLLPVKFQHPNLYFIQGNFEEQQTQKAIVEQIKKLKEDAISTEGLAKKKIGKKVQADCIICDIALNNIGNAEIDRIRSERIIELALWFCSKYLVNGGNFVCKALKGADNSVFTSLKQMFKYTYRFKPKASRKDSSEIFLVGIEKK